MSLRAILIRSTILWLAHQFTLARVLPTHLVGEDVVHVHHSYLYLEPAWWPLLLGVPRTPVLPSHVGGSQVPPCVSFMLFLRPCPFVFLRFLLLATALGRLSSQALWGGRRCTVLRLDPALSCTAPVSLTECAAASRVCACSPCVWALRCFLVVSCFQALCCFRRLGRFTSFLRRIRIFFHFHCREYYS